LPNGFELISSELTDKVGKIVSIPYASKIKDITFCEQLDVLSIGLQTGTVVNLRIDIEKVGVVQDVEDGQAFERKNPKETVLKLDWTKVWNADSLLYSFYYL
jgi:hypothetical protein